MKTKNLLLIGGLLVVGYVVYNKMKKKAEEVKKQEEETPKEVTITSTSGQIGATPTTKSAELNPAIVDKLNKEFEKPKGSVYKMATNRMTTEQERREAHRNALIRATNNWLGIKVAQPEKTEAEKQQDLIMSLKRDNI